MNAARAGGEEVPIFIYFHAIGQARPAFHPGSGVEEDAPIANSSVRLHVVGHPDGFVWIRDGYVQNLFIGRKGQAIWETQLIGQ